jgi:predicted Zn-dependent protease
MAHNDDQLATIMSHEVAHALARHGAERMSHQQISQGVQSLGNILVQATAPEYTSAFNTAYGYGTQLGVMLPYSRSHEHEADEIGIHLMKKAGYNINEAVEFWKNMKQSKGAAQLEFLSTHPNDDNRIERITQIVKKLNAK